MPTEQNNSSLTYADAGVDTEAGDRAVELMKAAVARTHGPEVVGGAGGFAGLFDVSALKEYRRPLLASSTDGVGTKVALAQALDKHDTVGIDLVAMIVDDLVVCGAKPLAMTDYIACGRLVPERIADIVRGIARGCELTGTALVGGETAEHPGLLGVDEYDVAGAAVGVVEADELLGPDRVEAGHALVAMASSGVHSNGFSLVRRIAANVGWQWTDHVDEFGGVVGEVLLTPTQLYTKACLDLADLAHAYTHITGGGLAANIARVIPKGLLARVDRSAWTPPSVFGVLAQAGGVSQDAMEATFNQGVGMVAVVSAENAARFVERSIGLGIEAFVVGDVVAAQELPEGALQGTKGLDAGACVLTGSHPA